MSRDRKHGNGTVERRLKNGKTEYRDELNSYLTGFGTQIRNGNGVVIAHETKEGNYTKRTTVSGKVTYRPR